MAYRGKRRLYRICRLRCGRFLDHPLSNSHTLTMKTRKRYTDEFKAQAVQLLEIGKPVSDVAADLGISTDLLYRWRREGPNCVGFDASSHNSRSRTTF